MASNKLKQLLERKKRELAVRSEKKRKSKVNYARKISIKLWGTSKHEDLALKVCENKDMPPSAYWKELSGMVEYEFH